MKRAIKLIFLCLYMTGCSDYLGKFDNYVESIKFDMGKYRVKTGSMECLYLNATPSDSFSFYEVKYRVSDEGIIEITDKSEDYCFIKGKKEGTCIVTAEMGNKETKCIVEVYE